MVVTGRHDHYGGDFNERFATALRFNLARLAERGVACEVILVEWNPIAGRPHLVEVMRRDCPVHPPASFRGIVVAPEYHAALTQNPQLEYLEYVAKNIGIRRARAPWVLVTNTDILLGRAVVETIAAARLEPGTIYRAARYDIKLGADQTGVAWDALEDPVNHVRRPTLVPPIYSGGSGDFVLTDRETLHTLRGYNEVYRAARVAVDLNFLIKAHGAGYRLSDIGGPVYHINHVGSFRISKSVYRDSPAGAAWGNRHWHARHVVYNNPGNWGLADAPERALADGTVGLEFDWRAVPPLVELRRIVLPIRHA
jgi:hypothetical protein